MTICGISRKRNPLTWRKGENKKEKKSLEEKSLEKRRKKILEKKHREKEKKLQPPIPPGVSDTWSTVAQAIIN